MAQKFLVNIDMGGNQLLNVVVQVLSTAPNNPAAGRMYFDSTIGQLRYYTGSAWVSLQAKDTNALTLNGQDPSYYLARANHTGTQPISTLSDHNKAAHDALGIDAATLGSHDSAWHVARANHTGTQLASTISDFDAQVRTSSLDQLTAAAADVDMNGNRLIGLADPTAAQDAVTKSYVDALAQGLDLKASVRAATDGNITLSGTQTVDGVDLDVGDRVLVKAQTNGAQNGIYVVAAGAWTRAPDADSAADLTTGSFTFVEEGDVGADTGWTMITDGPITLGTTALAYTQFSGAGTYTTGTGLTMTGTVIAIDTEGGYGVRKASADVGNGSDTDVVITHNLGTRDVLVEVFGNASPYDTVLPDIERTGVNTVTLKFAQAPTAAQYRVALVG